MRIVISLGGSVFMPDVKVERILEYANYLKTLKEEHKIYVVVGSGKLAKKYIEAYRELGATEEQCDHMGIDFTHLNAQLLAACLNTRVAKKIDEITIGGVMGGTVPGQTTDAVGAMLSERVNADLYIIATNVNGVYDKDPKYFKSAKRFEEMKGKELVKLIGSDYMAGAKKIVDPVAAKVIARMNIPTVVLDGTKTSNIQKAIDSKKVGTLIR